MGNVNTISVMYFDHDVAFGDLNYFIYTKILSKRN